MRKKWTYVAIVSMMLGVAPVFTGCVDTDEPAGITELRGAKAELLRAKAAVEQANAAYIGAQQKYVEAQARQMEALALQEEYAAELKRLAVELQTAVNETEKARLEKEKQYYEQQMELQQIQHEEAMANAKMMKATAERNLQILLEQIAIAEQVGSEYFQLSLAELRDNVQQQYINLYGGNYTDRNGTAHEIKLEDSYYGKLIQAQEAVYNATLNADQGIVTGEGYIPELELTVAQAAAEVTAQEEAIAKLENFLAEDVETTDWRGEIKQLEDALADLEKSINQGYVDLKKAQNSDAYLSLFQALYGVFPNGVEPKVDKNGNLKNWDKAVGDGAYQVWKKAEQKLDELKEEEDFTLAEQKIEAPVSDVLVDVLDKVAADVAKEAGNTYAPGDVDWQNLKVDETEYDYWDDANKKGIELDIEKKQYSDELQTIVEDYAFWNEVLEEATKDDYANAIAVAKINLATAQRELKTIQDDKYNPAKDKWSIALKAAQGEATAVPTTDFEKAVKTYNDAYTALKNAIDDYNKAYDTAYETAESKVAEDVKLESGLDADALATLDGFDVGPANTEWGNFKTNNPTMITVANFESIVEKHCVAAGGLTAAQVKAKALNIIDEYVADEIEKGNYDTEIQNAVDADETLQAKKTTMTQKGTAVDNLYTGTTLDAAISAYINLAAYPYGQVLTESAEELLTKADLVGIIPSGSTTPVVTSPWYSEEKKDGVATGHYVIANTEITAEEVTNATKTELDADKAVDAWHTASLALFGTDEAAVELSKEDVYATGVTTTPAYEMYQTQDYIQACQDAIDQVTDLGVLAKEVKEGYEALIKDMQTQYDEKFAEAEKAIEDAEVAKEKALADLEAEDAKNNELKADIAELEAKYKAQSLVLAQLKQAVSNILDLTDENGNDIAFDGTEKFEEALKKAIDGLQDELVGMQRNLDEAEIALQKAQDGEYDELSRAKLQLTIAENNFNYANNRYMELNQLLQDLLEDAAGSSDEEQPAE